MKPTGLPCKPDTTPGWGQGELNLDGPPGRGVHLLSVRHKFITTVRTSSPILTLHRAGPKESKPFPVKDERGQKDILHVCFSIINWTSANDAGFLKFHDDFKTSPFR